MPQQLIEKVGAIGLVSGVDVDPRKLPDGAWSDGLNVRFDGYLAEKVKGSRVVQGSLSTSAHTLVPHTTFDGSQFICYAGLTRVFTVNNNTHYELTRVSNTSTVVLYNADPTELWTGGVLGGLLFLNNPADVPQIQVTPTASCRLSNLPNWPTTITTRAACLRAYKNYLVALDITKGPQRYRQMVKWSASADPLTVPHTWDEADTTADAGENSLSESNGTVIDCLPLRDINIIYKDDSVHGMQFIGGQFIFRFYGIFNSIGILSRNCVCAFNEAYHLFIGNDLDIYVHDGQTCTSIGEDRWAEWLRENVDGTQYNRMFVVNNPTSNEVWIFVPTGADSYNDVVLMYNWRKKTWGKREVDNVSHGVVSAIESTNYVTLWSAASYSWDSTAMSWAELASLPPDKKLVLASPTRTTGLIETEIGSSEFGAALPFVLERTGMWAMACKVVDNGRVIDLQGVKFVDRIRFRTVDGTSQTGMRFMVAVQTDVDSPLVWATTTKMNGTTAEVTVFKRGRFLNLRIESDEDTLFSLNEIEIVMRPSGDYL